MFKHIVCWEFAEMHKSENLAEMKTLLEEMPAHISELVDVEVGLNVRDSKLAMDMVLITAFKDKADYEVYASHPHHKHVVERLHKVTVKAVIVDYET